LPKDLVGLKSDKILASFATPWNRERMACARLLLYPVRAHVMTIDRLTAA
jgi:hypothetical protein